MDEFETEISLIQKAILDSNIQSGYTGNCANIAVAIKEIALEDYENDFFRLAVVDRPNRLFDVEGGHDHIVAEYNGKYLDSKGIHSREEIIDNIRENKNDDNKPVLQIESRSYIESLPYYNDKKKQEIKSKIKENLRR